MHIFEVILFTQVSKVYAINLHAFKNTFNYPLTMFLRTHFRRAH